MKYKTFAAGIAVGLAFGAALPVLAVAPVNQMLTNLVYGIPRGAMLFIVCAESTGVPINNSSLRAVDYTYQLGTSGGAQGYAITCN